MTAVRLGMLTALLLFWVPGARTQQETPPAAKEVLKQFEEECAELEKKPDTDVKKRLEKTAAELKKVQDLMCKEAKLDEAVAVRELIRSLQAGTVGTLPNDLPDAAKEIYKAHEDEIAAFHKKVEEEFTKCRDKAAAELKKIQDQFCKEAKLDEAVAVRDMIRTLRTGVTNALPDPGYINAGEVGKVTYYEVTGTNNESIYGTDIYTTGSHLGKAAVHCGLLKVGQRGIVKVTMMPGQASYEATTRHGIASIAYGQWNLSFKVERVFGVRALKSSATALPDPGTLVGQRGNVGQTFLYEVTGSNANSAWGTDIYTDDSSLATAAVHAGVLANGQKGVVKVTILGGQESYASTMRNGVTSGSWGSWSGSYKVEAAK